MWITKCFPKSHAGNFSVFDQNLANNQIFDLDLLSFSVLAVKSANICQVWELFFLSFSIDFQKISLKNAIKKISSFIYVLSIFWNGFVSYRQRFLSSFRASVKVQRHFARMTVRQVSFVLFEIRSTVAAIAALIHAKSTAQLQMFNNIFHFHEALTLKTFFRMKLWMHLDMIGVLVEVDKTETTFCLERTKNFQELFSEFE